MGRREQILSKHGKVVIYMTTLCTNPNIREIYYQEDPLQCEKTLSDIITGKIEHPCKEMLHQDLVEHMKKYDTRLYRALVVNRKKTDNFQFYFNDDEELLLAISFYRTGLSHMFELKDLYSNNYTYGTSWHQQTVMWAKRYRQHLENFTNAQFKWYYFLELVNIWEEYAKYFVDLKYELPPF